MLEYYKDTAMTKNQSTEKENEYMDTFVQRVNELKEKSNMTYRELAEKIGVTEVTFARILNEKREPKLSIVIKIADYFGVSLDWLIGREQE